MIETKSKEGKTAFGSVVLLGAEGIAEWKKGLVVESRGQDSKGWGQKIRAVGLRHIWTERRL